MRTELRFSMMKTFRPGQSVFELGKYKIHILPQIEENVQECVLEFDDDYLEKKGIAIQKKKVS